MKKTKTVIGLTLAAAIALSSCASQTATGDVKCVRANAHKEKVACKTFNEQSFLNLQKKMTGFINLDI